MRLYIARHGETQHNVEGRIQGARLDAPLTAVGQDQADRLAAALRDRQGRTISAVYSSPLLRAQMTARSITSALRLEGPRLLAGFREIGWGTWDGQLIARRQRGALDAVLSSWRAGNIDAKAPGGESAWDVWTRTRAAINVLSRRHAAESVVIVAHEGVNKLFLSRLLHGDHALMNDLSQANGAATLIEQDLSGRWRLVKDDESLTQDPRLA